MHDPGVWSRIRRFGGDSPQASSLSLHELPHVKRVEQKRNDTKNELFQRKIKEYEQCLENDALMLGIQSRN
jgi:hypothetical protein